jgi:hypothetical protein
MIAARVVKAECGAMASTTANAWSLVAALGAPACDAVYDEHFAVIYDYNGARYRGTVSFPVDPEQQNGIETGTLESGDLPLASASSVLGQVDVHPPKQTVRYELLFHRAPSDDAAFAGANPPEPYAQCVLDFGQIGVSTPCEYSIEYASITMTVAP